MEAREKTQSKKDIVESYVSQINWDWLFFKGQLIFSAIMLLGLMLFFLWMVPTT